MAERNAIYPGTERAGMDRALKFVAFQSSELSPAIRTNPRRRCQFALVRDRSLEDGAALAGGSGPTRCPLHFLMSLKRMRRTKRKKLLPSPRPKTVFLPVLSSPDTTTGCTANQDPKAPIQLGLHAWPISVSDSLSPCAQHDDTGPSIVSVGWSFSVSPHADGIGAV